MTNEFKETAMSFLLGELMNELEDCLGVLELFATLDDGEIYDKKLEKKRALLNLATEFIQDFMQEKDQEKN